ncbi:MAG: sulfur carrier protein ThiS [Microlunatus sp.]|nr:sulfur carrier protein ThiS [Microlunatus sp.]MDN5769808.1 sulfur carrier protein ThiS [Microlunatus sp.]MDN5803913.1 sulfur carrier protein ThiS [Microlunatus sp.]
MIIFVNGEQRDVDGTMLSQVVTDHGKTEPRRDLAVAVNGSVVPRARWSQTALSEGAKVEMVTAVQGG